MVWIVKVVELMQLRSEKGGEKTEVAFMQYMEITAPLDVAK